MKKRQMCLIISSVFTIENNVMATWIILAQWHLKCGHKVLN